MSITHPVGVRTSVCDFIVDKLDVGAGARAVLEFRTATDVEVSTLNMAVKATGAFASAISGTALANAISSDSATGGTIAKFVLKDCNAAIVIQGSVTAAGGGGDIELNNITVAALQTVAVTSFSYTAMP